MFSVSEGCFSRGFRVSDKRQSAVLHMSDHCETPDFRPSDTLNTCDSASAVAARARTEDSGQLANTRIPLVRITFLEETPPFKRGQRVEVEIAPTEGVR